MTKNYISDSKVDNFISKTNNNVNNNEPPEYFFNQGTIKAYRMYSGSNKS